MSPQTKLRIYCMMAVMYKDEHENVISIVAGYVLDNIFSENWLIVFGERNKKMSRRWEEKKDRRESELYKHTSPVPLAPKKGIVAFIITEFFKLSRSVCEELSFQANTVTF